MKTKTQKRKPRQPKPKSTLPVLRQICDLIPPQLVRKIAGEHNVESKARKFSVWSHVVSLIFAQVSRAVSLNDVCDNMQVHSGALSSVRGATPPPRNTLSHANRTRNADMAQTLFWKVLAHLQGQTPGFGPCSKRKRGLPQRFKRTIYAVDSTTIQLVANCMDWAKHRRRKAAAKCHMSLNLQSFLPAFAVVDTAKDADSKRAPEVCANIKAGEIVVFDKAYVDFSHLYALDERGVFWVTRAKDNMAYEVHDSLLSEEDKASARVENGAGTILRDDIIMLENDKSHNDYPKYLRLVEAVVEVDGKEVVMRFITNNLEWAPSSICDLYRCRWQIEVFFKQIKQNLKLCDFLGHNANAVKWQVWIALLVYVLLRYLGHLSDWRHSFSRLCTMIRAVLWDRLALRELLVAYGTAGGLTRMCGRPEQAYFPGFG